MRIINVSIQFNVEVELDDGTCTDAQRDRAGNWWCTDDWRQDFTPAEAAELERQFLEMMPCYLIEKVKL